MSEYRSRVRLTLDIGKFKTAGFDLHDTQKAIYDFFMDKGFSYHRHTGFYYDRELTEAEWLKIVMELEDKGWFQNFHSFDTDVIGEIYDVKSIIISEEWLS